MTTPLEAAILRTILYADVFQFPLTVEEIHHYLMAEQTVSLEQVRTCLEQSAFLRQRLETAEGYTVCRGRIETVALRKSRDELSAHLWNTGEMWGRWLARLPFVRMVAMTGALAMRNAAHAGDDIDYLLVTAAGRVWLARGLAVVLVRIARVSGAHICPNFVLAETALAQGRRDVFIAHEVAQMVPLYGVDVYERFREANTWVKAYLPNAEGSFRQDTAYPMGWAGRLAKRLGEFMLGGRRGDWLENWEQRRKLRRFAADLQTPRSAAKLDHTQVKGHFQDHGYRVLEAYAARLRQHQVEDAPLAKTGD
ncbi:MAG: hypothetical protein JNM70_07200 [Anaerolineae bacterium]|nr:hypothetical protein [Anaerolineae bacterium]